MDYQGYHRFARSSLLENDTRYLTGGGLEEMTDSSGAGYKHEMLHGEYESSE